MNNYLSIAVVSSVIIASQWFNYSNQLATQKVIKQSQEKISEDQNIINDRLAKISDEVSLLSYAPTITSENNQQTWQVSQALLEETLTKIISQNLPQLNHSKDSNSIAQTDAQASANSNKPTYEESQAAYQQVDQILSDSIANGDWGRETAARMAKHRKDLTMEQRRQLLDKFAMAFNSGQIKPGKRFVPPPL